MVLIIISYVLGIIIVNAAYKAFMKIMGADGMFFSVKTKLIAIFIVGSIILGVLGSVFGLA